ncbi:CPBP family intramembrane glutamic endopeptidase [Hymenobacter metallicola]|uniref:CPBP family intramembrane metalloprotease n=1 Tax=Hymenobacter metallicola TaxID=2563114 RepID=A0A4Z0QCU1_9BACT|nr:CPBP family intramembrane glutamic endopeptidase [Hymenobacter metallicola]TGE26532.1 CPBP family intramembrane metalloprotease [Hymenobacter metallicola]
MKGFVSSRLHPLVNLMLLLGLAVATFCIAGFFATVFSNLFFGVGLREMGNVTQNPQAHPNGWAVLMLTQGITLFVMLAGAAWGLVLVTGQSVRDYFMPRRPVSALWLVAAAALIILSLPLMSAFIQWNADMHLPGFFGGFERWARAKEEELKGVTAFLTRLNSPVRLAVALLVIGVVPAISEELFFRGVIQRNLVDLFKSRHAGVFLAAAIFSAIHMQFLGFIPRFVLGLILGYLYEWSGNILVPMAAHFTQNAFQLLLIYVQQQQWAGADFDPDSTDSMPWYLVLLSALFTGAVLYFLQQRRLAAAPSEMHTLSSGGVAVASPETAPTETRTLGSKGAEAK